MCTLQLLATLDRRQTDASPRAHSPAIQMAIIADSEHSSQSAKKNSTSCRSTSPGPASAVTADTTPTNSPTLTNYANTFNCDLGSLHSTSTHHNAMSFCSSDSSFVNSVLMKSMAEKGRFDQKVNKDTCASKEDQSKTDYGRKQSNLNFSISNILNKESNLMHSLRDNILTGKH